MNDAATGVGNDQGALTGQPRGEPALEGGGDLGGISGREGKVKLPRTGVATCSRQEGSEAALHAEGVLAVAALAVGLVVSM